MLNAKLVQMIVDSAKAACEPEKDLERYVETLITQHWTLWKLIQKILS